MAGRESEGVGNSCGEGVAWPVPATGRPARLPSSRSACPCASRQPWPAAPRVREPRRRNYWQDRSSRRRRSWRCGSKPPARPCESKRRELANHQEPAVTTCVLKPWLTDHTASTPGNATQQLKIARPLSLHFSEGELTGVLQRGEWLTSRISTRRCGHREPPRPGAPGCALWFLQSSAQLHFLLGLPAACQRSPVVSFSRQ